MYDQPAPMTMPNRDEDWAGWLAQRADGQLYAAVSYYLHHERAEDHTELVEQLQARYDPLPYVEGTHFQSSFGHLMGYTSGYYT